MTCQLTTLETVKTRMGIDPADTSKDADITYWIAYWSEITANYCERDFCNGAHTQLLVNSCWTPQDRCKPILLNESPVVSVESVTADDELIDPSEYWVDDAFLYFYNGRPIAEKLEIQFTAGYETIPPDLEEAVIGQVSESTLSGGVATADKGPVKQERIEGAITTAYYDPRTGEASAAAGSTIGAFEQVLNYHRGYRAFI